MSPDFEICNTNVLLNAYHIFNFLLPHFHLFTSITQLPTQQIYQMYSLPQTCWIVKYIENLAKKGIVYLLLAETSLISPFTGAIPN